MIKEQDNLIGHLKDNWQIYGAITVVISTIAIFGVRLNNIEARQNKSDDIHQEINARLEQQQLQYADIQTRLASIETSIKYIERAVK
jgi:hypothetical protein